MQPGLPFALYFSLNRSLSLANLISCSDAFREQTECDCGCPRVDIKFSKAQTQRILPPHKSHTPLSATCYFNTDKPASHSHSSARIPDMIGAITVGPLLRAGRASEDMGPTWVIVTVSYHVERSSSLGKHRI